MAGIIRLTSMVAIWRVFWLVWVCRNARVWRPYKNLPKKNIFFLRHACCVPDEGSVASMKRRWASRRSIHGGRTVVRSNRHGCRNNNKCASCMTNSHAETLLRQPCPWEKDNHWTPPESDADPWASIEYSVNALLSLLQACRDKVVRCPLLYKFVRCGGA